MRAARTTLYRLGLVWSVSCFALSAMAGSAQHPEDMGPSDATEPVLARDIAATAQSEAPVADAEPRIDIPEPPAVIVSVPPTEPSAGTAALVLPDLPDAPVTVTLDDRIRTALADHIAKDLENRALRLPHKEREALAAFYGASGDQLLWVKDGAWTPAALALTETLKTAEEEITWQISSVSRVRYPCRSRWRGCCGWPGASSRQPGFDAHEWSRRCIRRRQCGVA